MVRRAKLVLFALFISAILFLAITAGCSVREQPQAIVHDVRVVAIEWSSVAVEKDGYRRWLFFGKGCSPYTGERYYLMQPLYPGAIFDYVIHADYPKCPIKVTVKNSVFQGDPVDRNRGQPD